MKLTLGLNAMYRLKNDIEPTGLIACKCICPTVKNGGQWKPNLKKY